MLSLSRGGVLLWRLSIDGGNNTEENLIGGIGWNKSAARVARTWEQLFATVFA